MTCRTCPCYYYAYFFPIEQLRKIIKSLLRRPVNVSPLTQWLYAKDLPLYASLTSNEGLVTIDAGGCVRLWETSITNIEKSLGAWRKMVGAGEEKIQITKERYSGQDVSGPKRGKVDKNNEPHVGGNTWAGGTGGTDILKNEMMKSG